MGPRSRKDDGFAAIGVCGRVWPGRGCPLQNLGHSRFDHRIPPGLLGGAQRIIGALE